MWQVFVDDKPMGEPSKHFSVLARTARKWAMTKNVTTVLRRIEP